MKNNLKLKHWWWYILPPSEMLLDKIILELSASNKENKEVTKRLYKKFLEKYYITKNCKKGQNII